MSETSSTDTGAAGPAKKGVSTARNIVGVVVLIVTSLVAGFQLAASFGYNNAVKALDKRAQDEDKGLMDSTEAETLLGKSPDGPGEEVKQNYATYAKKTYTWHGPIKSFTLTAYYTKDKAPGLHHFETDGAKYTPEEPFKFELTKGGGPMEKATKGAPKNADPTTAKAAKEPVAAKSGPDATPAPAPVVADPAAKAAEPAKAATEPVAEKPK